VAILSFKKRFAGKIRNGSKRQTIRAPRKYPIYPGETLYLYTALRTKYAKKLREVKCKTVTNIEIKFNSGVVRIDLIDDEMITLSGSLLNRFARLDGFKSWEDMKSFWIQEHGVKKGKRKVILRIFKGILITW